MKSTQWISLCLLCVFILFGCDVATDKNTPNAVTAHTVNILNMPTEVNAFQRFTLDFVVAKPTPCNSLTALNITQDDYDVNIVADLDGYEGNCAQVIAYDTVSSEFSFDRSGKFTFNCIGLSDTTYFSLTVK